MYTNPYNMRYFNECPTVSFAQFHCQLTVGKEKVHDRDVCSPVSLCTHAARATGVPARSVSLSARLKLP